MKSQDSIQLLQKISDTITKAKSLVATAPQVKQAEIDSYFAQFLIVFICGIYEEIIEIIVGEMTLKSAKKEIFSFVKKTLEHSFRNPNINKVKELFSKFENQIWNDKLNAIPEANKSAFDSIAVHKNSLAHGQSPLNLTISDVETYFTDSKVIIEEIDNLLL